MMQIYRGVLHLALVVVFVLIGCQSALGITEEDFDLWYDGYFFRELQISDGVNNDTWTFRPQSENPAMVDCLRNGEPVVKYGYPMYIQPAYPDFYYYCLNKFIDSDTGQKKIRLVTVRKNIIGDLIYDGQLAVTYEFDSAEIPLDLPPTNYEEHMKGKVMITIPNRDYFSDTTSIQVIGFSYGVPMPSSGKASDISIKVEGGITGTGEVISHTGYVKDGYYYGNCRVTRELEIGNNTIVVKVTSGGLTYSATRIITRLQGQVDEDGDGIDDRTGLPIWPDYPNNWDGATDGPPLLPGENATIFDYIKWFADSILYSMGLLVTTIKGFMGGLGQISRMFGEIFVWIPKELIAIMILGVCMTVVLRVVGR